MLNIVIGYDQNESVAFHVLAHSIMRRASGPVSITPLYLGNLEKFYDRPRDPKQSTDFTFSRFLTPYVTSYSRVSIFMDCDMLCLGDVYELQDIAVCDPYSDVFVVKHDYTPKEGNKFLDQPQTVYPCKNWSSVMVFNGHRTRVKRLTPEYVNSASAMEMHQFKWAHTVGSLPKDWNHLVGEYKPNPDAKLVHYTLGGPWFPEYKTCEYARAWFMEAANAMSAKNNSMPHFLYGGNSDIILNSKRNDHAEAAQTETDAETEAKALRRGRRRG